MRTMFDVIKHEGDDKNLIYKFENEDFNTLSQLVVQQGQEAIFYYKGSIADRFDKPGTYTLTSQNIPILRRLVNLPFGKTSPFHAVVYFINKTEQMNNKWGVGGIPFIDQSYPIPIRTGISGEYNFKVNDPEIIMNKLAGTMPEFSVSKVRDSLDAILRSRVVEHMSGFYRENEVDIFVIESRIGDIGTFLERRIREDFLGYGIEITKFVVTNIAKGEESDEYKRYFEYRTQQQAIIDIQNQGARAAAEAQARMRVSIIEQSTQQDLAARAVRVDAEATKYKRDVEGYTYQQERGFDVAEKTAQNEGAGSFASAGMGLGMGIGAMGAAARTVGGIYNDALSSVDIGFHNDIGKQEMAQEDDIFAGVDLGLNEGTQPSDRGTASLGGGGRATSRKERLKELKELLDDELITREEYEAKRNAILEEI